MKMLGRICVPALTLLVLTFACGMRDAAAAASPFGRTVSLGSSGEDVRALQQILNQDPSTQIAATGPGSSGQETGYFGLLTREAVIRFQEKYAAKILAPNGLAFGTGIVGPATRAVLTSVAGSSPTNGSAAASSAGPISSGSIHDSPSPTIASQNPNLRNIDRFMATLDRVAAEQGMSSSSLAISKEQVMKQLATTTDLRAAFLDMVQKESKKTAQDTSLSGRVFALVTQTFNSLFMPERAHAAMGIPFGGALVTALPCACSADWILYLEPLPPSYAVVLTYIPGTQAFSYYNIPATLWLLGFYEPGVGVCLMPGVPCYPLPAEGMITPVVGSSLL